MRSDVVARPPRALIEEMLRAEIGAFFVDRDIDDPTVHSLEKLAADVFRKEAALFVSSITMANLIACMHYCSPGEQAIIDEDAHVYLHESGGISRLAAVVPRIVPRNGAAPDAAAVERVLRSRRAGETPISLLWLENTHTEGGGAIADPGTIASLARMTRKEGIPIHVDGARIFNAAVALGVTVDVIAEHVDSVSITFAKGLGCPLGSLLIGSRRLINAGVGIRHMLGGAWPKAGLLAGPCIAALTSMVARLHEDHIAAQRLGAFVETAPHLKLDCPVVTNIIRIDTSSIGSAPDFRDALYQEGVWVSIAGNTVVRAVTHLGISMSDIERAIEAFRCVCQRITG